MTQEWAKWEKQVINGVFPLHSCVSFSDHSAVFLTEHAAHDAPHALLKLVPAIPTLKETQLAHWSAAATLAHPNLIRLLEAGRCQLGGLQFLFVVMEYAEATLAKILTQHALAPGALRNGMRPILASLAFLHRKHLVQGGLKPTNILLVNQQLKLASDTVRPTGESTASIAGSSVYDPPESPDGSISTAGDIWSLGVFMVEALTQRRPSWPDKRSPTAVLPDTLPPQFVQIVRQCLSRDPADRPTVAELAAQIDPVPQAAVAPVNYPVLLPPRFPILLPPESPEADAAEADAADLANEEPEPVIPARQSPKRRSFIPAGALILVILIVAWVGLRVFGSQQAYLTPTAWLAVTSRSAAADLATDAAQNSGAAVPAATLQGPGGALPAATSQSSAAGTLPASTSQNAAAASPTATLPGPGAALPAATAQSLAATTLPTATAQTPAPALSASSALSTAAPNPGSVESTATAAPPSVLHEEAPDVPPGALQTIHGHIKFAVRVTVDPTGTVVHATLAGHSPSRYFTRVAIETAQKWRFVAADSQGSRQWLLRFEFTRDGATAQASSTGMRRATLG